MIRFVLSLLVMGLLWSFVFCTVLVLMAKGLAYVLVPNAVDL